ncbi:hypothetical protein EX30DRAFT_213944 [Ascodesmis nigricans]|uniref:Mitochondrial adapter protein MCP1 transmembrane domain-containing protein n=1 Tax=Ascodesmis nigricans TaxID=341454 RepID=A0A4S2MZ70_9PEZI|nr:hypothetical protein EX30DRAFT_213944 [Ascodesmis nigricans]
MPQLQPPPQRPRTGSTYSAYSDDDNVSLLSMRPLSPSPLSPSSPATDGDDFILMPDSFPPLDSPKTIPGPTSVKGVSYWLSQTQKYSSYTFLTFLGIHFTTTALTPLLLPLDSANSSLLLTRTYFYQATPLTEAILVPGSLAVHIASGLLLRALKYRTARKNYGGQVPSSVSPFRWRNLTKIAKTGWVLVPLVAAHAVLLRWLPLVVDGDSSSVGLEYVGWGFLRGLKSAVVSGVAYTALVGVGMWHTLGGVAEWWKVRDSRRRTVVTGTQVVMGAVWLAGVGRVVWGSRGVRQFAERQFEGLYRVFLRGFE